MMVLSFFTPSLPGIFSFHPFCCFSYTSLALFFIPCSLLPTSPYPFPSIYSVVWYSTLFHLLALFFCPFFLVFCEFFLIFSNIYWHVLHLQWNSLHLPVIFFGAQIRGRRSLLRPASRTSASNRGWFWRRLFSLHIDVWKSLSNLKDQSKQTQQRKVNKGTKEGRKQGRKHFHLQRRSIGPPSSSTPQRRSRRI